VRHAVAEQHPVREAGQRVVERLVRQLLLELAPLAHITGRQHDPMDVRVVQQVRPLGLGVDEAAVGPPHPELERRRHVLALRVG